MLGPERDVIRWRDGIGNGDEPVVAGDQRKPAREPDWIVTVEAARRHAVMADQRADMLARREAHAVAP